MSTSLINIKCLVNVRKESRLLSGKELAVLPVLGNAYLIIEGDEIAGYGQMADYKKSSAKNVFDASGKFIIPAWCDSHTHLVYPASREDEFVDKIRGISYAEIAARGGGILNSARRLENMSEEALYANAWKRLEEVAKLGTGSIEIKSGYGLSVEAELKMLRVIRRLQQKSKLLIRSTFLGAHTYPSAYKENHPGYIRLIIEEMLPVIQKEKLADYIDVFCEEGFFSREETEIICKAGMKHGLIPKIHANQLSRSGGVQAGISVGARSVDHLESIGEEEIKLLAGNTSTICTLLPAAAFFLRMPMQPARILIDAGATVAIASDYNPGSAPSGNMNFVVALSCIQMKMYPEEAINAATINGAYAMDLGETAGSITIGKKANLILTKEIPSLAYLPYSFGSNCIDRVMIGGEWLS
ncbi:MAG TPA: imidazolonepropionase [Flavitalea sp.]|nr:imidazolonepropionase [Flavitalea sp.]